MSIRLSQLIPPRSPHIDHFQQCLLHETTLMVPRLGSSDNRTVHKIYPHGLMMMSQKFDSNKCLLIFGFAVRENGEKYCYSRELWCTYAMYQNTNNWGYEHLHDVHEGMVCHARQSMYCRHYRYTTECVSIQVLAFPKMLWIAVQPRIRTDNYKWKNNVI